MACHGESEALVPRYAVACAIAAASLVVASLTLLLRSFDSTCQCDRSRCSNTPGLWPLSCSRSSSSGKWHVGACQSRQWSLSSTAVSPLEIRYMLAGWRRSACVAATLTGVAFRVLLISRLPFAYATSAKAGPLRSSTCHHRSVLSLRTARGELISPRCRKARPTRCWLSAACY